MLRVVTGNSPIEINLQVGGTQTGTAFDRRPIAVVSSVDGWTQYSKPAEMGDIKYLFVINPSTNTQNVNVATVDGSSNKITTNTIVPGDYMKLAKPDPAKLFFNHAGGTGTTQEVDLFAVET